MIFSLSTNLFLCLLKPSKSYKQVFIHMLLSKELDRSLVHLPPVSYVAMLLFKTSILDPVLHLRVNDYKCGRVMEFISQI